MATKSAGRVSIRVVPDSTGFRRDLKQTLDRLEKQLVAKIRAELYVDRASLAKLKREIESLVIKIKPSIELNISPKDLEALKVKIESIKPKVAVDLDTKEAAARVAALTRTRTVEVNAKINRSALDLLQNMGTRLGAMAGLGVVLNTMREGAEFMNKIDQHAVSWAKNMTIGSAAISSISSTLASLTTIGADALNVGKLSLFAPAFLSSAAISIGVLIAVLKDMGTVLADLGPRFTAMQKSMSKEFWGQAAQPIRDLANKYLPTLNERLDQSARNFGKVFATLADTISESMSVEDLDWMFVRLNDAIADIRPSVASLTRAFVTLGKWGVNYLPRFVNWVNKLTDRFDKFIDAASKDGRLDKWAEEGIKAFFDLGRIIGGVTESFVAIDRAARAAGFRGLTTFADGMERVADVMNSERFQKSLTMFFQGVHEATDGILRGIRNLGPSIEAFIPTLTNILGQFGGIFEKAFGVVGTFLENKDFQNGLMKFVGSISKAFDNLKPSIDPLAGSLGKLVDFMGDVLEMASRLMNSVFTKLGPKFDEIVDALKPFLAPIEELANTSIGVIETILDGLAKNVLPPLKDLFINLKDPIKNVLEQFTPTAKSTIEQTGLALQGVGAAVKFLTDALKETEKGGKYEWLGTTIKSLNDMLGGFDGASLFEKANFGLGFSAWLGKQIREIDWASVGASITEMWDGFWKLIVDGWNRLWTGKIFGEQPGKWIGETIENLKTAFKPLNDFLDSLFKPGSKTGEAKGGGGNIGGRSVGGFIGVDNTDTSWFDTFKATVTTGMSNVGVGITEGGATAKVAWDTWWTNLSTNLGTTWETIKLSATTYMGGIGDSFTTGGATAKLAWDTWWTNLNTGLATTWETIKTTVSTKMGEIGGAIETGGTIIKTGWDTFWTGVGNVLQGKWGEFQGTTQKGVGQVDADIGTGMGRVQVGWSEKWAGIGSEMNSKWNGIIGDVQKNAGQVSPEMVAQMQTAQRMWTDSWNYVTALTNSAWTFVVSAISNGLANAGSVLNGFRGIATSALNINLSGSGSAMIQSFAAGISAASGWVTGAVQRVIEAARAFFPNSPAKTGPFSGRGYTPWSGRALVKDFASGMMDNMSMVKAAAEKVTNAARLGVFDTFGTDGQALNITKTEVNMTVNNPVAEPTSRTVERTSNSIRLAGA